MSLRAVPKAGKLSPPKRLPWVNQALCAQQNFWTPKLTRHTKHALWKDARDNGVSNNVENRQDKCLPILRKQTRAPCDNLGWHCEVYAPFINKRVGEPQIRTPNMLLIRCSLKVYTRVHDNQIGVLTCPRLMWNKKPQICAPWNIWKQRLSDS